MEFAQQGRVSVNLSGKIALVSGASQGLGFAIAQQFAQQGAHLILCARDQALLDLKKNELEILAPKNTHILALATDVSKPTEVERLLEATKKQFGHLDILVANAGIYGPKGPVESNSWEEWSQTIDINLKGVMLQCHFAIPLLQKSTRGKIIILSGGGATKPMPYLSAYAASKAGVVRFAETLAEELKQVPMDVNAVAPGAMNTRFLAEGLAAGPEKIGAVHYEQLLKQKAEGGAGFERAVALCLYLACAKSNGITGRLISAVWDPWKTLDEHVETLQKTDIYTLRRILPEDRNESWDKK